jgi:hypothetical protein
MRGRPFALLALAVGTVAAAACSHPARLTIFDASLRPAGYHWAAHRIRGSRDVEYYGVDPSNGWTVYVGPDGLYYAFPHAAPITTRDLHSYWDPHDVARAANASSPGPPPAARLRSR